MSVACGSLSTYVACGDPGGGPTPPLVKSVRLQGRLAGSGGREYNS